MKKTIELKEIRSKSEKELLDEIKKQEKKLREFRFDSTFRKTKDIRSIDKTKKKIARLWTILSNKLIEKASEKGNK